MQIDDFWLNPNTSFWVQTNLGQKNVGLQNACFLKKNWVKKDVGPNNVGAKDILDPTIFGPQNCWLKRIKGFAQNYSGS